MQVLKADELARALVEGRVDFIIVGGFAVNAHGVVRATKDVDIVPSPELANLQRLAGVLRAIGAGYGDTKDFAQEEWPFDPLDPDDLAQGGNFVMVTRFGRLDVLQWISGVPTEHAYDHLTLSSVETTMQGVPVRVCSFDDLVAMKRAAGRGQDLEDLRNLGVEP